MTTPHYLTAVTQNVVNTIVQKLVDHYSNLIKEKGKNLTQEQNVQVEELKEQILERVKARIAPYEEHLPNLIRTLHPQLAKDEEDQEDSTRHSLIEQCYKSALEKIKSLIFSETQLQASSKEALLQQFDVTRDELFLSGLSASKDSPQNQAIRYLISLAVQDNSELWRSTLPSVNKEFQNRTHATSLAKTEWLDIRRFLMKESTSSAVSFSGINASDSCVRVLEYDQLSQLSPLDLNPPGQTKPAPQMLFINMNKNPHGPAQWVLLSYSQQKQWELFYHAPNTQAESLRKDIESQLKQIINAPINITYQQVDMEGHWLPEVELTHRELEFHIQEPEIPEEEDLKVKSVHRDITWPSVMLGRVYPYLKARGSKPESAGALNDYLAHVPFRLLMEGVRSRQILMTQNDKLIYRDRYLRVKDTGKQDNKGVSIFKKNGLLSEDLLKAIKGFDLYEQLDTYYGKKTIQFTNEETISGPLTGINNVYKALWQPLTRTLQLDFSNPWTWPTHRDHVTDVFAHSNELARAARHLTTLKINGTVSRENANQKTLVQTIDEGIACNRFLTAYLNNEYIQEHKMLPDRQQLGVAFDKLDSQNMDELRDKDLIDLRPRATKELLNLFQKDGALIDADLIARYLQRKEQWLKENCANDSNLNPFTDNQATSETLEQDYLLWQLLQFPQLGRPGLADSKKNHLQKAFNELYLSKWSSETETPIPKLETFFDLAGNRFETSNDQSYLGALADNLRNIFAEANIKSKGKLRPHNIFKSFALALSNDSRDYKRDQSEIYKGPGVSQLFGLFNDQYKKNDNDFAEIKLFNVQYATDKGVQHIKRILNEINEINDLKIMPILPELDRLQDATHLDLKNQYRILQNKVLDNQRKARAEAFVYNTKKLNDLQQKEDLSAWPIEENELIGIASEEIVNPLETEQQSEQEQAQEQAQEKEQEQEQEQEKEHERITPFPGKEEELITRANVDEQLKKLWDPLPKQEQEPFKQSLKQLFNRFVGSTKDADKIITKITPEAWERLNQFSSKFSAGISTDNLPAGFVLQHTKDNDSRYVLCFDSLLEKKEQLKNNNPLARKRNPYQVRLSEPLAAQPFVGDYRQFDSMARGLFKDQNQWPLLGQWFTQLNADVTQKTNAKLQAKGTSASFNEVSCQYRVVNGQLITPEQEQNHAFEHLRAILKGRLAALNYQETQPYSEDFRACFLKHLTAENILAMGQAFYRYDASLLPDNSESGSEQLIRLSYEIYKNFGEGAFLTWKKQFFDASKNHSELLEQLEVNSVCASINELAENQPLGQLWWKMVALHCQQSGSTPYADLWDAYSQFTQYLNERQLPINFEAMNRLLEHYRKQDKGFHLQVVLERINTVMGAYDKNSKGKQDQIYLLDNLDKMDWTYSGIYYAMKHNGYNHGDVELQFHDFTATRSLDNPNYWAAVDPALPEDGWQIHALRYLAQMSHIEHDELENAKLLLQKLQQKTNPQGTARALLCCVVGGKDKLQDLTVEQLHAAHASLNEVSPTWLSWFSSLMPLEQRFDSQRLQSSFTQLPHLLKALEDTFSSPDQLAGTDLQQQLNFVNACARLLDYWSKPGNTSKPLAQYLKEKSLNPTHSAFIIAPWLYATANSDQLTSLNDLIKKNNASELVLFYQQVQTIDLVRSGKTLSIDELSQAIQNIAAAPASEQQQIRRSLIKNWVNQGHHIRIQDSANRILSDEEKKELFDQLLKASNKIHLTTNQELYRFLLDRLAINSSAEDSSKQLIQLKDAIKAIDDKKYFNEVGGAIGLLTEFINSRSTEGSKAVYSIEHLTQVLNLMLKAQFVGPHFPRATLERILAYHQRLGGDSSLANIDLDKLQGSIPPAINKPLEDIIKNYQKLNASSVADLTEIFLTNPTLQIGWTKTPFYQKIELLFSRYSKTSPDAAAFKQLSSFLLNLAQHPQNLEIITNRLEFIIIELLPNVEKELLPIFQQALSSALDQERMQKYPTDLFAEKNYKTSLMFLLLTLGDPQGDCGQELLEKTLKELKQLNQSQLKDLVLMSQSSPVPLSILQGELSKIPNKKEADKHFIHWYESVYLATENGKSKRHYSVTAEDRTQIARVFREFKNKKNNHYLSENEQKKLLTVLFYQNAYADKNNLANIPSNELRDKLKALQIEIQTWKANDSDKRELSYPKAEMLALMREILLRKTGKWCNHTQMITLLDACINDHGNVLYQMKTGEGKSILTTMRTAFIALQGDVVDVFSAKESLSKRDHEEFSHVLGAFGLPNTYVSPASAGTGDIGFTERLILEEGQWKEYDPPPEGITETRTAPIISIRTGAVNYATVGNMALCRAKSEWDLGYKSKEKAGDFDIPYKRRAFVDEIDHVLREEDTQFNYVDEQLKSSYNPDSWVYETVYRFYLDKIAPNIKKGDYLTTNKCIKELCVVLQEQSKQASTKSTFVRDYIDPAFDETIRDEPKKKIGRKNRNKQLERLLMAAHKAHHLQRDRDFCVVPDTHFVGKTPIEIRRAVVVIDNQPQKSSTYSESVHALLLGRLNCEAAQKGEANNFFIPPEPQIAVSYNTEHMLRHDYDSIEGCTGTGGNQDDMQYYNNVYNITTVRKIPTNKPTRSIAAEHAYCSGIDAQAKALADAILQHDGKGPILITCQDDRMVKALYSKIEALVGSQRFDLIKDTNDSGLNERELLTRAGKKIAVTLSARMGRGTDIKPEKDAVNSGLFVIRSYQARSRRIAKQEWGRQGRNYARGQFMDIIDVEGLTKTIKELSGSNKERFDALYKDEEQHLQEKLNKHEQKNSTKWSWLRTNTEKRTPYLQVRAFERFSYEQEKQKKFERYGKEFLIAKLCRHFTKGLSPKQNNKDKKATWLAVRNAIEVAWRSRLNSSAISQKTSKGESFEHFLNQVKDILKNNPILGFGNFDIDKTLDEWKKRHAPQKTMAVREKNQPIQKQDFDGLTGLYQSWLNNSHQVFVPLIESTTELSTKTKLSDDYYNDLNKLFIHIKEITNEGSVSFGEKENQERLLRLAQLFTTTSEHASGAGFLPCNMVIKLLNILSHQYRPSVEDKKPEEPCSLIKEQTITVLQEFFAHKFWHDTLPQLLQEQPSRLESIGHWTNVVAALALNAPEEASHQSFIDTLIQCYTDHAKDQYANYMQVEHAQRFVSSNNLFRLISDIKKPEQLHQIIHALGCLSINPGTLKHPVDRAKEYLEQHYDSIKGHPELHYYIMEAALTNRDKTEVYSLPSVAVVHNDEEGIERAIAFWKLLARCDTPASQESVEELSKLIQSPNPNDLQKALRSLPAHIPLDFIIQEIKTSDAMKRLDQIAKAGEAYNNYLNQYQVKRYLNSSVPASSPHCRALFSHYLTTDINKAVTFFDTLAKQAPNLSISAAELDAHWHHTRAEESAQLQTILFAIGKQLGQLNCDQKTIHEVMDAVVSAQRQCGDLDQSAQLNQLKHCLQFFERMTQNKFQPSNTLLIHLVHKLLPKKAIAPDLERFDVIMSDLEQWQNQSGSKQTLSEIMNHANTRQAFLWCLETQTPIDYPTVPGAKTDKLLNWFAWDAYEQKMEKDLVEILKSSAYPEDLYHFFTRYNIELAHINTPLNDPSQETPKPRYTPLQHLSNFYMKNKNQIKTELANKIRAIPGVILKEIQSAKHLAELVTLFNQPQTESELNGDVISQMATVMQLERKPVPFEEFKNLLITTNHWLQWVNQIEDIKQQGPRFDIGVFALIEQISTMHHTSTDLPLSHYLNKAQQVISEWSGEKASAKQVKTLLELMGKLSVDLRVKTNNPFTLLQQFINTAQQQFPQSVNPSSIEQLIEILPLSPEQMEQIKPQIQSLSQEARRAAEGLAMEQQSAARASVEQSEVTTRPSILDDEVNARQHLMNSRQTEEKTIEQRAQHEAVRIASEQAAQQEAERVAAKQKAQREAERLAAEQTSARASFEQKEASARPSILNDEVNARQHLMDSRQTEEKTIEQRAQHEAQQEAERVAAEQKAQRKAERLAEQTTARASFEQNEASARPSILNDEVNTRQHLMDSRQTEEKAIEQRAQQKAVRIAAEQKAQRETERLAAEQEAQREAERLAAKQVAQREAERLAAEQTTARGSFEQNEATTRPSVLDAEVKARQHLMDSMQTEEKTIEQRAQQETARIAEQEAQREAERLAAKKQAVREAKQNTERTSIKISEATTRLTIHQEEAESRKWMADKEAKAKAIKQKAHFSKRHVELERKMHTSSSVIVNKEIQERALLQAQLDEAKAIDLRVKKIMEKKAKMAAKIAEKEAEKTRKITELDQKLDDAKTAIEKEEAQERTAFIPHAETIARTTNTTSEVAIRSKLEQAFKAKPLDSKKSYTSDKHIVGEIKTREDKNKLIQDALIKLNQIISKASDPELNIETHRASTKEQFKKLCLILCENRSSVSKFFRGKHSTNTVSAQNLIKEIVENNALFELLVENHERFKTPKERAKALEHLMKENISTNEESKEEPKKSPP